MEITHAELFWESLGEKEKEYEISVSAREPRKSAIIAHSKDRKMNLFLDSIVYSSHKAVHKPIFNLVENGSFETAARQKGGTSKLCNKWEISKNERGLIGCAYQRFNHLILGILAIGQKLCSKRTPGLKPRNLIEAFESS